MEKTKQPIQFHINLEKLWLKLVLVAGGVLVFVGAIAGAYWLGVQSQKMPPREAPPAKETPSQVEDQVIVGFKKGLSVKEALAVINKYSLTIGGRLGFEGEIDDEVMSDFEKEQGLVFLIEAPTGEEDLWIKRLENDPKIKYAELNQIIQIPDCRKEPC